MSITSKVEICNLALSHLGNYGTISNIDTPTDDKEIICAQWYDITRQMLLKKAMPNFALGRKLVAELVVTIPFGYAHAFEYPIDCLKVLGLGNLDEREQFTFSIEAKPGGNGQAILTDDEWEDGLQLRYIKDISLVTTMSPEFKLMLSWELAANIALPVTQDAAKAKLIRDGIPGKLSELSGLNAQENRPIRRSVSRFLAARTGDIGRNAEKK
jgi:hypothetical protein